jgi:hypothetical protein
MPAILTEHQLELLNANDETQSLLFGTEDTGYLTLSPPDFAAGDAQDGDVNRQQEDGRYFGRDLRGGGSVGFEIGVITDRLTTDDSDAYRSNSDYLDALQSWWDDEELRTNPWDLAVLRACVAGRTWRAYGRPRRFTAARSRLMQLGYTPVVCDFAVLDNRVYADDVESVDVPLVSLPDGGLIAPLVAPLTTTAVTEGERVAVIGGSKATWAWAEFHGPVTDPRVEIGPLVIGLSGSIPPGMTVTVDPRPWSRGVTRDDGANYAGMLSIETPVLRELKLKPNKTGESYPVVYSGTDATGTSQCFVYWRNARSAP